MDDDSRRVESLVRDLERTIGDIDRRLTEVERTVASLAHVSGGTDRPARAALSAPPAIPAPPALPALPGWLLPDPVTLLAFVGRTFVALGGAFSLRALTDASVLPLAQGSALGLAYGLGWLVMSDRAAAVNRRTSAVFHGLVAAVVTFPLIWESVTHFQLVSSNAAAVGLALVTALMLAAALRQRSQSLAWIAVLASIGTTLALVSATGAVIPFTAVTIALGLATLWIGYSADWVLLRWPVALVADLMVLALTLRVTSGSLPDPPAPVIALQLLLLTGHLASVAARTLVRGRNVNVFEVVQTGAALAVGFGGAVYVTAATGAGAVTLAAMNLIVGAGCYAVAFAFPGRQHALRRNFYFYTSLGLLLVMVSTALLLDPALLTFVWTALAVASSSLARRTGRITLDAHATVYVLAAAGVSGLLATTTAALVGPAIARWPPLPVLAVVALAGLIACWLMPAPHGERMPNAAHLPWFLITLVLVWSAAGTLVGALADLLPHGPAASLDGGVLATVRTSVLAAAALAVAWAGRTERFRESGWLLYPLLAAGGVKLLVEDLPRSRPATLFIALALYGSALILAPRLSGRSGIAAPPTRM
jgi:hypothetical protein